MTAAESRQEGPWADVPQEQLYTILGQAFREFKGLADLQGLDQLGKGIRLVACWPKVLPIVYIPNPLFLENT